MIIHLTVMRICSSLFGFQRKVKVHAHMEFNKEIMDFNWSVLLSQQADNIYWVLRKKHAT